MIPNLLFINLNISSLFLFYLMFLRNETFFNFNRVFLLGSTLFAVLLPLSNFYWIKLLLPLEPTKASSLLFIHELIEIKSKNMIDNTSLFNLKIINTFYWIMVTLFACNFLRKLYLIKRKFSQNNQTEAYSFFGWISIGRELKNSNTIALHESVHQTHLHSLDIIIIEIFKIFNWFNPIVYLLLSEIKSLHEFTADEIASANEATKADYALLLFEKSLGTSNNVLINKFYNQSLC